MTRITISADSAPTHELRAALAALNKAGLNGEMKVSLNGPECWAFSTPPLKCDRALMVLDAIHEEATLP